MRFVRGEALSQMALAFAGGGESCLDAEHLSTGGARFGSVPSDTTVDRRFHEIRPGTRDGIAVAAKVRTQVRQWSLATSGSGPVLLVSDASPTRTLPFSMVRPPCSDHWN